MDSETEHIKANLYKIVKVALLQPARAEKCCIYVNLVTVIIHYFTDFTECRLQWNIFMLQNICHNQDIPHL